MMGEMDILLCVMLGRREIQEVGSLEARLNRK